LRTREFVTADGEGEFFLILGFVMYFLFSTSCL
jgi:hypothetical protein